MACDRPTDAPSLAFGLHDLRSPVCRVMDLVGLILPPIIWILATVVILLVDARRMRAKAAARGEVDFADRSPTAYLALALIAGPLPLIMYFWATRRTLKGLLIGLAWAGGIIAVSAVVFVLLKPPPPPPFAIAFSIDLPPELAPTTTRAASEPLVTTYAPDLRELAERVAPRCQDTHRVEAKPSPAKATALDRDPKVLQLEVWCVRGGGMKIGFASLKTPPESRRLGGIWPQRKVVTRDASGASITLLSPSGASDNADEIQFVTADGVLEIDLDVAR